MSKANDNIEILALKKICNHMQTVADKYAAKHAEIVKANIELLESGDYGTESDIMDAYGYDDITEEQKDKLLDMLENGTAAAESETVWSVAARILRKDIRSYKAEISEIEYQLMSPAERKKHDESIEKFAEEQKARRERRGESK